MRTLSTTRVLFISLVGLFIILGSSVSAAAGGLSQNFYDKTCPGVYETIQKEMASYVSKDPSIAAALLRLHFHDCFVRGCDGSVLLDSTESQKAEKDVHANSTLRGFSVIDGVKAEVEKLCPGIVSCADISALVTRDAVHMLGGPSWNVPTGRRDGLISIDTDVLTKLPPVNGNFSTLKSFYANNGLTVKDLVVLSGGHTIGRSRCKSFNTRLYNFTGKGDMDPSLDKLYAVKLKIKCRPGDNYKFVEMDPGSFRTFDTNYYANILKRRGLFQSDASLLTDSEAVAYLNLELNVTTFFSDFAVSMEKMGRIGVLTGSAGQIRRHCAFTN